MRIADRDPKKNRESWKTSREWRLFLGEYREKMKLASRPEPFDWRKTMNWLSSQVAATLKTALMIDEKNGTNIVQEMIDNREIPKRLRTVYEQLTTDAEKIVMSDGERG